MTIQQVHVKKDELTSAELVHVELQDLPEGSIRLEIESFSVTANNITYAVVGDGFKYWDFFPAPDGFGIVPMWGHARIAKSRHDDFSVGERVYGYLPMATHLDVQPGKVSASSFMDTTDYRQPMSPIYNTYQRLAADPEHDPSKEAERMIFGPLFKTGFLIEYFMRSQDWFDAEQVILTSASSKTAMGLASVARENSPGIKRVGLTSSGNVDFVVNTGLYDKVASYGEVGMLPIAPSVSVDFAGNAKVLGKIHEHYSDTLKYSCLVGATHIEERGGVLGGGEELPGPKPTLFFAPDHAVSFFKEHGPEEGGKIVASSWRTFLLEVGSSVEVVKKQGLSAARDVYLEMIGGSVDPAKGIVIEF